MVNKKETKKPHTKLMQIVCLRAALMRSYYRGSSWETTEKAKPHKNATVYSVRNTKQTSQFCSKAEQNVLRAAFSAEKGTHECEMYLCICILIGYYSLMFFVEVNLVEKNGHSNSTNCVMMNVHN